MKINTQILKFKLIFFLVFFSFLNLPLVHGEISLYELKAEKIIYKDNSETIIAEGNAQAKDQFGKTIFADKILYNKKKSIISTYFNSIFFDTKGNRLFADSFLYDLNSKNITADKNVEYIDNLGNIFKFTNLEYNETTEKGIGKNLIAALTDKSSVEGSVGEFDNTLGTLTVSNKNNISFFEKLTNIFNINSNYYTPCENKKKTNQTITERCPDWSLSTQETTHDKINKMVYHYGAVIKIKNIPVFYTPYFSHPDPSVKRKSGFLTPSIKNFSDLGSTFKTPYYWVIDEKKDMTFSPIYYFDENPLYLAEYRQQNIKSKFYIDTSYTEGYKNLTKNGIQRTDGSRNHFFFNFLGNYDDLLLNKNDLEINIQKVSQKNYLNVNQINTQHVKQDITALNNNIILNSYENNKRINLRTNIYENLNDDNKNTKYQYIFPAADFSNFFNKFDQYINLSSSLTAQNTGGDSSQSYMANKIDTTSEPKISSVIFEGLANTFKTSINNLNYYNQNITGQKENFNSDTYFTAAVESFYPLMKINNTNEQTISPKIFSKYTSGSMQNSNSVNKILSYEDIYSMNRMNSVTIPETGFSVGYGVEFNSTNKNTSNEVYSKSDFKIGQIIKPEKEYNMPNTSTLADKSSAFVGSASFSYDMRKAKTGNEDANQNMFNLNYDYQISNDFNKILKNNIQTEVVINKNNIFKANYYETHDIGNVHYVDANFTKKFENNFNFKLGGRKNLQDNFSEQNYIEASYDSDCLTISLNLSKQFYNNQEIRPSKALNLTIMFKPFGTPISPDISSLLN